MPVLGEEFADRDLPLLGGHALGGNLAAGLLLSRRGLGFGRSRRRRVRLLLGFGLGLGLGFGLSLLLCGRFWIVLAVVDDEGELPLAA